MNFDYIENFTVEPGDEAEDFFPITYKVYVEDSFGFTQAEDMDIVYEDLYELNSIYNVNKIVDDPNLLLDMIDDMDNDAIDETQEAFEDLEEEGYKIPVYQIVREDGYGREQIIFQSGDPRELQADREYDDYRDEEY